MMSDLFLEFWSFNDPNVIWVLVGSMLLGGSASIVGGFTFLRKKSLTGDVLAHASIPGVMTSFILFQTNSQIVIFISAMISSLGGLTLMNWLPKNTKIKPDAAMAITLSFFFALGLMELSFIQSMEVEGKSGLDKILFGQAAAILPKDLYLLSAVSIIVLLVITLLFQKLRLISFNYSYGKALGLNMFFYETILALLVVSTIVIGLQIVGVVLMAAVLLTPVAAAKFWSNDLSKILFISSIIGALAGLFAANISYMAASMPTGPWMVVILSLFFILSLLFSPKKGLFFNFLKQHKLRLQISEENVLRTLYLLNERLPKNHGLSLESKDFKLNNSFSLEDILTARHFHLNKLKNTIKRLYAKGLISHVNSNEIEIGLSKKGMTLAIDLTRKHRLWETYLSQKADIDPKNVHYQAELVEHLLTQKQVNQIEDELSIKMSKDPHGMTIPERIKGFFNGK